MISSWQPEVYITNFMKPAWSEKGRVGYSRYGRDAGNMKKPAVVAGFFVDMRLASVLQPGKPEKPVG